MSVHQDKTSRILSVCLRIGSGPKGELQSSSLLGTHGIDTLDRSVHVGVTESWDATFGDFLRRAYHYYPKNLDHNSGHPIGISVCQQAAHNGKRTTAAGAYLACPPANLKILTHSPITKLIIEGNGVVGIEAGEKKSMLVTHRY